MMSEHTAMPDSVHVASTTGSSARGKIILLLLLTATIGVFFYFDLTQYLSLEALKANRDSLLAFTEAHYLTAVSLFISGYCLLVAVSLPGAVFLTLAGGFLFGSMLGTVYVNLGATTGSTLAFLSARYLLRDWVEAKFGSRLGAIQDGFSKNAFSYLMTLRLIPIFPFFLVNLVSGLTRVKLVTYIVATSVGIIPGSFVYAYAGRQLGMINSLKEIASPNVLLAFTLLGLLALVPVLYRKFSARKGE
ncbi:MAG: TVP38/TMEM64 family protein [Nitrospirae bacterium]|nr:TVP38/TMEM64 family protein [Nitrospirota bacterium]